MIVTVVSSLRDLRTRAGDTLAHVAVEARTTAVTISRIERGRQPVSLEVAAVYHRLYRWGMHGADTIRAPTAIP